MVERQPLWTIEELSQQVVKALAVDYAGQLNGQVTDVPNLRTIRYYTTLGLLDRPAAMKGRTALYGKRHLMQLVAIKRLQSRGLALHQVQEQLAGITPARLSSLANLPACVLEPSTSQTHQDPVAADGPSRRDPAFWSMAPAPVVDAPAGDALPPSSTALVQAVPVSSELTLLITVHSPLQPHEVHALRQAASPLLQTLRGLVRPQKDEET